MSQVGLHRDINEPRTTWLSNAWKLELHTPVTRQYRPQPTGNRQNLVLVRVGLFLVRSFVGSSFGRVGMTGVWRPIDESDRSLLGHQWNTNHVVIWRLKTWALYLSNIPRPTQTDPNRLTMGNTLFLRGYRSNVKVFVRSVVGLVSVAPIWRWRHIHESDLSPLGLNTPTNHVVILKAWRHKPENTFISHSFSAGINKKHIYLNPEESFMNHFSVHWCWKKTQWKSHCGSLTS